MKIELLIDLSQWRRSIVIRCNCGHESDQHHLSIEDEVLSGQFQNGCTKCDCKQVFDPQWEVRDIKLSEESN